MTEARLCACGCGQPVRWMNRRPRTFIYGHAARVQMRVPGANKKADVRKRSGYVVVNVGGGKSRPVHVLIAEKVLGRRLKRNEVVHHINGVKDDNRNSNLLICTIGYHGALHRKLEKSPDWPQFVDFHTHITHCVHGHEMNEANSYFHKKTGYRYCRACRKAREYRRRGYIGYMEVTR